MDDTPKDSGGTPAPTTLAMLNVSLADLTWPSDSLLAIKGCVIAQKGWRGAVVEKEGKQE
jgi:hypothetical protein